MSKARPAAQKQSSFAALAQTSRRYPNIKVVLDNEYT
jgi:hypothetical protein